MTKEQALQLLDQVVSGIALNRADHLRLVQALNILRQNQPENPSPKED